MIANEELENRTAFYIWVRDNLNALDLGLLEERLTAINLNAPISPQTAFELIDEVQLKNFMRKGQRIPGLIQKKGNIFRVSLFAALCSLPLTQEVFACLIQHRADVSKITGATSPLSLAIYGNQDRVAHFLLEHKTQLNFEPGYNQNTQNLEMTQQLQAITDRLDTAMTKMQTQIGELSAGLFGPGVFQAPPPPPVNNNLELELADTDLPLCEPHLQLCVKLNRLAVFETIAKHPHCAFSRTNGSRLVTYVCHNQWDHSVIPYLTVLKERGAPLDTLNDAGHTPLHLAIIGLRTENVKWLLANGANAFIKLSDEDLLRMLNTNSAELSTSKIGQASFFNAESRKKEITGIIKEHKKAVLTLCKLAQSKDPAKLEAHLQALGVDHYLINAPYYNEHRPATALDYAISSSNEQCVQLMIQYGAKVNQISQSSREKLAKMTQNKAAEFSKGV